MPEGTSELSQYGVELTYNTKGAELSVQRLGGKVESLGVAFKGAGQGGDYLFYSLKRIATYTAIFAFVGGLVKLMDSVFETELRLAEVGTLLEKGNVRMAKEFETVKNTLLELDPHLGSSTELARGLYEIMSAGVNKPIEAMKLLLVSAKYAKVGLTDLATSAQMLTSIMKAYGFSADQMRAKADVLFTSVAEGKFHMEDLNEAIGNVLPTAAAMGVTVEEVSAALALLSNRGLSASESATALNRLLISFLRPIGNAKEGFQKIGQQWGINAFQAEGFTKSVERLKLATERYSDLLPQLFHRETGLKAAFILTGDMEGYTRLLGRMKGSYEGLGIVHENFVKITKTVKEELKAWMANLGQAGNQFLRYTGTVSTGVRVLSIFTSSLVRNIEVLGAAAGVYVIFTALHHRMKVATEVLTAAQIKYAAAVKLTAAEQAAAYAQATTAATAAQVRLAVVGRLIGYLAAATIAYYLAKTALDAWQKSLDAELKTLYEQGAAYVVMMTRLRILAGIYKEVTGGQKDLTAEMQRSMELKVQDWLARVVAEYKEWNLTMKVIYRDTMEKGLHMTREQSKAFMDMVKQLAEGNITFEVATKKYAAMFTFLGKALGIWDKIAAVFTRIALNTKGVTETLDAMDRRALEVIRTMGNLQQAMLLRPVDIAQQFSRDEIANMQKLIGMLVKPTPEDAKFMAWFKTEYKEQAEALEKMIGVLKKTAPALAEAFRIEPLEKAKLLLEDLVNLVVAASKEKFLPTEDADRYAQALYIGWTRMKALGQSMESFAAGNQQMISKVMLNLSRISSITMVDFIKSLSEALSKGLTEVEKMQNKLKTVRDRNSNEELAAAAMLEKLRNELRGEEYENVVVTAEKFIVQKKAQYREEYLMAVSVGENIVDAWEKYNERMIQLENIRVAAAEVAWKREWEVTWENIEKLINANEKYRAVSIQFVENLRAQMKAALEFAGISGIAVDLLLADFDKLLQKLKKAEKAQRTYVDDLQDWYEMLTTVSTSLKDLSSSLGDNSKDFKAAIEIVDSAVKTFNVFIHTLKICENALAKTAEAGKFVKMSLMEATSAIGLVISIISMVITVMTALSGAEEDVADSTMSATDELKAMVVEFYRLMNQVKETDRAMAGFNETITKVTADMLKGPKYQKEMLESLSEMMDKTGIDLGNMAEYWKKINAILREYEHGVRNAGDASKLLGDVFSKMVEAARRLGVEGSKSMTEFIKRVKESGLYVKEVVDYINDQLGVIKKPFISAAEGLLMMAGAADVSEEALKELERQGIAAPTLTEEAMRRLERATLAVFNAMILNGATFYEAMNSLGPVLDKIIEQQKRMGIEAGAGIRELIRIREVTLAHQGLFDAIEGNLAVLDALANTGSLTQEMFTDAAKSAADYYKQLTAAGFTSNQALAQMAPTLARIRYLSKEYGFTIDEDTQKLIDQAEAQGLLKEAGMSMVDAILGGFGLLLKALGIDIPKAMQVAMDKMYDVKATTGKEIGEMKDFIGDPSKGLIAKWYEYGKAIKDQEGVLRSTFPAYDEMHKKLRDIRDLLDEIGGVRERKKKIFPVYDTGGIAFSPQIAQLAGRGPEAIIPLVDLFREIKLRQEKRRAGDRPTTLYQTVQLDLDGERIYSGMKKYIKRGAKDADFEMSGDGVY